MLNLKKMIRRYIAHITSFIIIVILVVAYTVYMLNAQAAARARANSIFVQIEQLLANNEVALDEVETEYSETCLNNARAIAYLLELNHELLDDTEELRKIAKFMEVDEIHLFDKSGRIFAGTHPEYYNLTFDSGEQMMFFKPMLTDKSLELVQEVTPNTAEAKSMQYSALWSEHNEFIVQVGMEPEAVMKATENNEISYIFSMLKVDAGVDCYALDIESGKVVGSTATSTVGKTLSEVGFTERKERRLLNDKNGFHAVVNGARSFCVFSEVHGYMVGRVVSIDVLYANTFSSLIGLVLCCIAMALVEILSVTRYMNRYVVDEIHDVNHKLRSITMGELDEHVKVQSSQEFAELSDHINAMVKSLLANNRKLSYVTSQTNMHIGVYEYGDKRNVRITQYVPLIFGISEEEAQRISADSKTFRDYVDAIRKNPIPDDECIYKLEGNRYIRLDEIEENEEVFGVVIDMTEEITKRIQAEAERDIDALTSLYNRRGLDVQLANLFENRKQLDYGALIMIDADGLKEINDKYGHDCGDIYLQKIAKIINGFGISNCLAARLGGDEFVLFLYQYDSSEELIRTIETLEYIQNSSTVQLKENLTVSLRFSYGYTLIEGRNDYVDMLKEADEKMYENKRKRKTGRK